MGNPFYSIHSVHRGGRGWGWAGSVPRERRKGGSDHYLCSVRGERRKGGSDCYFDSMQAGVIPCGKGEVRYEGPGVRTLASGSNVRALAVPLVYE